MQSTGRVSFSEDPPFNRSSPLIAFPPHTQGVRLERSFSEV